MHSMASLWLFYCNWFGFNFDFIVIYLCQFDYLRVILTYLIPIHDFEVHPSLLVFGACESVVITGDSLWYVLWKMILDGCHLFHFYEVLS